MDELEEKVKGLELGGDELVPGYCKDPCFHDALLHLRSPYRELSHYPDLEIEFRLGRIDDDDYSFSSNISKDFFEKIHKTLKTNPYWEEIKEEVATDYFHPTLPQRLSIGGDGRMICVSKEKLATVDFALQESGIDVRVCFSRETPLDVEKFPKNFRSFYSRRKERVSYIHKDNNKENLEPTFSFDLTKVYTIENTVESVTYECEVEIINRKHCNEIYMIHSSLLKVKDIVKMCDDFDDIEQAYLEHVQEKFYTNKCNAPC